MGARDLMDRGFTARDVLVGIAASGGRPYVLGAIAEARRVGAVTVESVAPPIRNWRARRPLPSPRWWDRR